jgi:hypothetical protein
MFLVYSVVHGAWTTEYLPARYCCSHNATFLSSQDLLLVLRARKHVVRLGVMYLLKHLAIILDKLERGFS